MNPIKPIEELPDWEWQPHCEQELGTTGPGLIAESDTIWKVGNVAVAGFIYHTLTSPPWMWFVLAKNATIADLIDFRRVASFIPKGTITAVDSEFKVGLKFAKLYNFEETGETQPHPTNGKIYKLMRKI